MTRHSSAGASPPHKLRPPHTFTLPPSVVFLPRKSPIAPRTPRCGTYVRLPIQFNELAGVAATFVGRAKYVFGFPKLEAVDVGGSYR